MLDRHEQDTLAEIEAHLHAEDPALSLALDSVVPVSRVGPAARSACMLAFALLFTAGVTLLLGPNLGGLAGVLSLSYAFLYSWAALRACRGARGAS